jgi:hypothetical protein
LPNNKINWHTAFYQAIQAELADFSEYLTYETEHQLAAEPLRIDMVIVKKPPEVMIGKNIGRIFRSTNIIEYKSPDDSFSVYDYFKTKAYANLYTYIKHLDIRRDITLTLALTTRPRELFKYFRNYDLELEDRHNGIYYMNDEELPIQFLLRKELDKNDNLWLKGLDEKQDGSTIERIFDNVS